MLNWSCVLFFRFIFCARLIYFHSIKLNPFLGCQSLIFLLVGLVGLTTLNVSVKMMEYDLLDCGECSALFGWGFDWFSPEVVNFRSRRTDQRSLQFLFLVGGVCVCPQVFVIILVENFPLSAGLFCINGVSEVVSFLSSLSEAFIWFIKLSQSFGSSWINVDKFFVFFSSFDCFGIGSSVRLYYHLPCFIIRNIIFIFYWENFLFNSRGILRRLDGHHHSTLRNSHSFMWWSGYFFFFTTFPRTLLFLYKRFHEVHIFDIYNIPKD